MSQYVPRGSASPGDLGLIFEDHGVSWLLTFDEMFAFELVTYRRCFPAQPILSALQRSNRRKCAHLLRDLAATADWPPHSALFSLQLLDLAHRWSERGDNDIHTFDVLPLAASVYIHIKLHSALCRDPNPLPDPHQPARPLADLLGAIAGLHARREPHNAPLLHTAWTNQRIVTEEYRIQQTVNCELGTYTPEAWIEVFKQRLSLWCQQQQPRGSPVGSPQMCLLVAPKTLLTCMVATSHSQWIRSPVKLEWRLGMVSFVRVLDWSHHIISSVVHVASVWSAGERVFSPPAGLVFSIRVCFFCPRSASDAISQSAEKTI